MSGDHRLTIAVHFDLVCPWCLIGKRQLEFARARFALECPGTAIEVQWRPVTLLPDLPEGGLPFTEFYERRLGSPEAVRQRRLQVELAANKVGLRLDLAGIPRMPSTARARALLRHVDQCAGPVVYEAMLERLFAAHFQRGEDIGDAATLASLAAEFGLAGALPAMAAGEASPAPPEAAVVGVPYFVFNGGISLSGAHDADVLLTAMKLAMYAPKGTRISGEDPRRGQTLQ